ETMGSGEKAAVIDLAVIAFDPNPEVVETFDELVSRGIKIKFDLKSQKGHRLFTKSTIEWWKNQSPEARKNIAPSDEDVSTIDGIAKFNDYINAHNIDPWKSQGWCRGMSFDFPILVDLIR
ncbi:3'-5' exoribonuclease domain-containing protein, partial [Enterococcus faecalis]